MLFADLPVCPNRDSPPNHGVIRQERKRSALPTRNVDSRRDARDRGEHMALHGSAVTQLSKLIAPRTLHLATK